MRPPRLPVVGVALDPSLLTGSDPLRGLPHFLTVDVGGFVFAGPQLFTRSYPFSAAESATYCLVKNAVKMFKDIGVSSHCLW